MGPMLENSEEILWNQIDDIYVNKTRQIVGSGRMLEEFKKRKLIY